MGGTGSGPRPKGIIERRKAGVDKAWENTRKILDGNEKDFLPLQAKASLDIALRTVPQETKQEIDVDGSTLREISEQLKRLSDDRLDSIIKVGDGGEGA